jgi:hypothetical protein
MPPGLGNFGGTADQLHGGEEVDQRPLVRLPPVGQSVLFSTYDIGGIAHGY